MCSHYWQLEGQGSSTSLGYCKYCNESRKFFNAFPYDKDYINSSYYLGFNQTRMYDNDVDSILLNPKSRSEMQKSIIRLAIK